MRIGIDARELCGRATGVGRYLAGLLTSWSADDRARRHEFVLYAPEPIGIPLDARRFPTRTVPGPPGTVWEQLRAPAIAARDHLDVWFWPAYTAPLTLQTPFVVTVHDVSFAAHPEWFGVRDGARRRLITRHAARRAHAVITVSRFSRQQIVEYLDIPEHKIYVVPPGIGNTAISSDVTAASDSSGFGSVSRDPARVLFVGSILNRRHVVDLIRAFAPMARVHPEASLDIVGENRSHPHEDLPAVIAAEGLIEQVHCHAFVSESRLADLYSRASAFAFLSEYEGLGLTPLEALAAGVPPLVADTSVARETCGEAALYVSLHDLPSITRALTSILFSTETRASILAAAPGVLARYDWTRAARETLDIIERSA